MEKYLILIVSVLCIATINAEPLQISLDDAVSKALENNKTLLQAKEDVEIYRQQYNAVKGSLFPQLSLNGGIQHKTTYLPNSAISESVSLASMLDSTATDNENLISGYIDGAFAELMPDDPTKENSLSLGLKLDQVVFMGGKLINGINIAGKLYHLQEKKFILEEQNTIYSTKEMYYQTVLSEDVMNIQKDALELAKKYEKQVQDMYDQGLVSEYNLLRAKLAVANLEPEFQEATKNHNLAKQALANFLGLDDTDFNLNKEFTLPENKEQSLEESQKKAKANRIEIELSELSVEVQKVNYRYESGNFLPTIGFSAEYNHFGTSSQGFDAEDFGSYYQFGLGFSMPLFTGLSNTAKKENARHSLKKSKLAYSDLLEMIELDVKNSYLSLQNCREKVSASKKNVELAEKALQIATARYTNQISNQLEVLDAQMQLKSARLNYKNQIFELIIAYEKYKKAVGIKL